MAFNPKLATIKLLSKLKFSTMAPHQRIAYANLGVTKVSDLVLACDLDLSMHQILDLSDDYKVEGSTYLARFGNRWATVMSPADGAGAWESKLIALISAGAKKIIQVGVCGSVSKEIKIGDLAVAESVYIDDDTSKCHTKKKIIKCDNEIFHFLKNEVQKIVPDEINLHFVRVVSIPTLFGQTKAMLRNWSKYGETVDMEAGVLAAICNKNKVEWLGIYAVVDDKLRDRDIFRMADFPMGKIFDNGDFLIRALIRGVKDYNLGKPVHGKPK
jgi:nucleoside phosphorylase